MPQLVERNSYQVGHLVVLYAGYMITSLSCMDMTSFTSGTSRFIASSIPFLRVIRLKGQLPQAPSSTTLTTISGVISASCTSPPSFFRNGRMVSSAFSILSTQAIVGFHIVGCLSCFTKKSCLARRLLHAQFARRYRRRSDSRAMMGYRCRRLRKRFFNSFYQAIVGFHIVGVS